MNTKFFVYVVLAASLLTACGDDSSTSPSNDNGKPQVSSSSEASTPASSAKIGGSTLQMETNRSVKSDNSIYLRCLMD